MTYQATSIFLETKAEIRAFFFVHFLGKLKTPQFPYDIFSTFTMFLHVFFLSFSAHIVTEDFLNVQI